jgi:hypothetical protein
MQAEQRVIEVIVHAPVAVVLSGKRMRRTSLPRLVSVSTSLVVWVVLPHRSTPSNTISAPRRLVVMIADAVLEVRAAAACRRLD